MRSTWRKTINVIRSILRLTNGISKKPGNTPFKQQSLPAWKPIFTAQSVIPIIFFIGASFVPIGIGMILIAESVKEMIIPYTDCKNDQGQMCKDVILNTTIHRRNCTCNISFQIEENWSGNVFIYYGLVNFNQNHRRYVRSRDDAQLLGNLEMHRSNVFSDSNCSPYLTCKTKEDCCSEHVDGNCTKYVEIGTVFLPCGAIANSMFNDEISLWYEDTHFFLSWVDIGCYFYEFDYHYPHI